MILIPLHKTTSWLNKFWSKVKKTEKCWIWEGGRADTQYGEIGLNGKTIYAHRASYEICNGEIPKGLFVLHRCDNPPCVNPKHLWLGTQAENIQDCISKGRARRAYGENTRASKLTRDQATYILSMKGKLSQRKLGDIFGVTHGTIGAIQHGRTWK
jgi:hypothetical protein